MEETETNVPKAIAIINRTFGNAFKVHAPPVIYGFGRYI